MEEKIENTGCCPPFDPAPWDGKIHEWDNKLFVKQKVCTFFFMPLNFGKVMIRINKKIESSGAKIPDWLCLSDHTSKWNMDIYLAVDKEIEGEENVRLSGTFLSKVYEGDFKETGKWCKDFEAYSKTMDYKIKKWYMWYTTCPKCAKVYGKNYVVVISQME
jgi:hypothetical protein